MRKLLPFLAAVVSLGFLASAQPTSADESPAYLALGDSLAFGVGASDPQSDGYVAQVHEALSEGERYRDSGLDLINLAVPGATSSDLLLSGGQLERALEEVRRRQEGGSPSDDVEIVTLNIGGNDVLALATNDSPCIADPLSPECQDRFQTMLGHLEGNLTETLSLLREAAPEARIVVMDLYSPLSGRGGAGELVADFAVSGINEVTQQVVSKSDLNVELARVYPLFRGRAAELVADDDLHPNDRGHAIMAEVVRAVIERRTPDLPARFLTPVLPEVDRGDSPLGQGGLLPLPTAEDDSGSDLPIILAIAIPASLLGAVAVVGAYLTARGR